MRQAAWKWMLVATAIGAGVLACSDDGDDDGNGPGPGNPGGQDAGVTVFRPGFGEDEGAPEGTPLSLPSGVMIGGTTRGANDSTLDCENGLVEPQGSGQAVVVCVPFVNTNGVPVEVELPPGLIIISKALGRYQNGLLVERVRVTIPPTGGNVPGGLDAGVPDGGTDPNAVLVPLNTYCLNLERTPSEQDVPYAVGPITNDPDMEELLSLLAGKTIDTQDEVDAVQGAIYSITEHNGLTDENRRELGDL